MKVQDKTVLVTGGTGFLGRHLAAAFLGAGAERVLVYARSEKTHYDLRVQFAASAKDGRLVSVIGDVRDAARLAWAVRQADIVVHAAAMKHITHCEENPTEAYLTNVGGAANMVAALDGQRVVFISTDKAVAPVNVYGATKMLQEGIFRASDANCVGVRYGNVLSSSGSVVPFFRERAQAMLPLLVTHGEMTRFFITVAEAVGLVMEAIGHHGVGDILIPRPRSARIYDVAQCFADKYGVGVQVVGPRPGEKMHESLLSERDAGLCDLRKGMAVIRAPKGGFENLSRPDIDLSAFTSSGPVMVLEEVRAFLGEEGEL